MKQEEFHSQQRLYELSVTALQVHNTAHRNAVHVSEALLSAQVDGQAGHGLSRLPFYCAQSASGKVNGNVEPVIKKTAPAVLQVDACEGFAYPAIALAIQELIDITPGLGIALAAISRSHHFGVAGQHVERLADAGLIGLMLGNSPKAMAPWGGRKPLFGTNPIAFAAPRSQDEPVIIDLSMSKIARGKIMLAAQRGEAIPAGWALDVEGKPTTDPREALQGSMLPMADARGSALALMVEIMAAALTGSHFGFEASSYFEAEGEPPSVGQVLIAIDPLCVSGDYYFSRLDDLIDMMLADQDTRLPGSKRMMRREAAAREGVAIDKDLYVEITQLTNA